MIGVIDPKVEERQGTADEPEKKVGEPKLYQAVFYSALLDPVYCALPVLTTVFNKNGEAARGHIFKAARDGRDLVLIGTRDVVETKAAEANAALDVKESACPIHLCSLTFVGFSVEPAP